MACKEVDVLICGSGSAGICAAVWLAKLGISCTILESRRGPLEIGQADGVQCRTVEMFDSFGLAEELLRESYHVLEVTFWSSQDGGDDGIARTARIADTQPGLSYQPHVILNQARVNEFLLDAMRKYNGQQVSYGFTVKGIEVDEPAVLDHKAHCVKVVAEKDGVDCEFKAKYVLGCDGAHSVVRKSLGISMVGDSTDSVWGVMDIYPLTNFPDIRKKVVIRSNAGSLLIVPREGGSLTRFYIELPHGTVAKDVVLTNLQQMAKRIFMPYSLDIAETVWWSAYSIGQRVASHFTAHNRVFLAGDACHTHSPKAGQGMNASLQDGYNLGWKLAAILRNEAPTELLETYTLERGKSAAALIEFDRGFARSFSSRTNALNGENSQRDSFTDLFIKSGVYTAGLATRYIDSSITSAKRSNPALASNVVVGMRFPSAQVVRFCDARVFQLSKILQSDGRWRIVVFGGNITKVTAINRLRSLGDYLDSAKSPIRRYTRETSDIDSLIEVIVALSGPRSALEQEQIPSFFSPTTSQWKMRDLHKVFVDDGSYNSGHGHAYDFYGIDKEEGALIIVRPDQYVSMVIALNDYGSLEEFFSGVFV